jgi:hypothetical protein
MLAQWISIRGSPARNPKGQEMAVFEEVTAKPKSIVIRMLGVFASLFGLTYLIEAVELLLARFDVRSNRFVFHLLVATITLDFIISIAAIVIGVGLFLHKEWARKAWLVFLLLLLFVHINMTVIQLLAGSSRIAALDKWIVIVVLVSVVSWAFLSKASIKARFQ